jgi:hypothetical protein
MEPLAGWDNFYVIVGSAAGGLTGLTFVVITLIRDVLQRNTHPSGLAAFVTPTIVQFGGLLALSAYMSMPHQHVSTLSAGLAVGGLAGVLYGAYIASHMRRQRARYVPVFEDWLWNVILPTLVYCGLLVTAASIWSRPAQTLYGVALLSLLLLLIGIHNAWDIAVWLSFFKSDDEKPDDKS